MLIRSELSAVSLSLAFFPSEYARAMTDLVLAAVRGESAPAAPVLLRHRVVFPDSVIADGERAPDGTGFQPVAVVTGKVNNRRRDWR